MFELKDIENLLDHETKIGDTTFLIDKMPSVKGWVTLLSIRQEVGKTVGAELPAGNQDAVLKALFGVFLQLPTDYIIKLQAILFDYVRFKNGSALDFQILRGAEEMAFQNLEPINIGEVIVRSLAINFTNSFRDLAGRISGGENQTLNQS